MDLEKARLEFVQTWGNLGTAWGIPRSMAQIHAYLMMRPDGVSTEEVMETLMLSRGNVNTNLRELINWRLIDKVSKLGERKDFYKAKHDITEMAQAILDQRKKKEFLPVQSLLIQLKNTDITGGTDEERSHFTQMIKDLDEFVSLLDQLSDLLVKMNSNMVFKRMIKLLS